MEFQGSFGAAFVDPDYLTSTTGVVDVFTADPFYIRVRGMRSASGTYHPILPGESVFVTVHYGTADGSNASELGTNGSLHELAASQNCTFVAPLFFTNYKVVSQTPYAWMNQISAMFVCTHTTSGGNDVIVHVYNSAVTGVDEMNATVSVIVLPSRSYLSPRPYG